MQRTDSRLEGPVEPALGSIDHTETRKWHGGYDMGVVAWVGFAGDNDIDRFCVGRSVHDESNSDDPFPVLNRLIQFTGHCIRDFTSTASDKFAISGGKK
jgi:hypothetical protein